MSVREVASPSLSTGSYELVEPDWLHSSATDEDSDDDGNDIVLSPRATRNSHISASSFDNLHSDAELDIEERDFVLVLPGSSVLSSSSVASPVLLSRRESIVLHDGHDVLFDSPLNDDTRDALTDQLSGLSIHPTCSEGHPIYPICSEDTSMATTPTPASPPSFTLFELNAQLEETQGYNPEPPSSPHHMPVEAGKPQSSAKTRKRSEQRKRAKARKAGALANKTNNPTQHSPSGQIEKPKQKKLKKQKDNATVNEVEMGGGGKVESGGKRRKARSRKQKQATSISAVPSLPLDEESNELYEEAVKYMDQHISSPPKEWSSSERLATAQALLVELGVTPTPASVPRTLRSARRMLASSVHLNILDYLALRHKGLTVLRNAMHSSRKSLRIDLQKRRAALNTVKSLGLRDLLLQVSTSH